MRDSRGSSPRLVFDVRPCQRARLLWTLFGLSAAVGLCFSFKAHPAWTLIGSAVALALAWLPGRAVLLVNGLCAVSRFEWAPDGRWHLTRPDGRPETGRLTSATATLGPWILLAWAVETRRWSLPSGRYALIGVGEVGPPAFRALTGRLVLLGARDSGASGAVAP